DPGSGLGVIVRTVSAGTNKTTLQKDLQYLKRLWKGIRTKAGDESAPALVYQEPGLARRAARDYLTDDINEVWVDDEAAANAARETINLLFPRKTSLVKLHQDPRQSLWERFDIQRQLEQIYSREINLPSGGRLAFDQTEALMAIDINSGKIHGKGNFEAMALKTNLEAAETIARQLRLRDIGGQIVIDFIEMRDKNHVRDVEKVLRQAMKNDRARHDIGRISPFGLLELVRQRTGSSALAVTTELCPCCNGSGLRRNMEWQALQTLRGFSRQMRGMNPGSVCSFDLPLELGLYLLNEKRARLRELEKLHNMHIEVRLLRA
ncbi:MAG: ribonuclease E/G, partial [Betaproteobacteria bacterium]|nr:ribonuclease E/G [Betaproteobacteria bacterium]